MLFGEVFIEERNNKWNTPYLFNAKELDEETGLYYYGARYYDPRTSVWLSTDPLQEKYPNKTSYHYCSQNPVNLVDLDGRDDYRLDQDGNITFVKETKAKNHTIYATNSDGELDKKNSYNISKHTMKNSSEEKRSIGDNSMTLNIYSFFEDEDAEGFFKFVATNSNVEWSNTSINYQDGKGNSLSYNLVATSHNYGAEESIGFLLYDINKAIERNSITGNKCHRYINFLNHSHTNGSTAPSGQELYDGRITADVGVAIHVHKINGHNKATFDIYDRITKKYYPYKATDRPWELNEIIVLPQKK